MTVETTPYPDPETMPADSSPDTSDLTLSEDEEDEEDGEGGDDHASLNLETPETAQAIKAAMTAAKAAKKGAKGKAGTKGRAVGRDMTDKALGLDGDGAADEKADADEDLDESGLSAYDRDEITDIDGESIDPLMALVGAGDKPWENESLSMLERMTLAGYNRNDPRLGNQDADAAQPADKNATIKKAAVAAGIAAAGIAMAARADAGVQAAATAAQQSQSPRVTAPPVTAPAITTPPSATQTQTAQPTTAKIDKSTTTPLQQALAAQGQSGARQSGAGVVAPERNAPSYPGHDRAAMARTFKTEANPDLLHLHEAIEQQRQARNDHAASNTSQTLGHFLQQTMNLIYSAIGPNAAEGVTPYREMMWDERRRAHRENAADVTNRPDNPENVPKPQPAPEAKPELRQDLTMNLGQQGM